MFVSIKFEGRVSGLYINIWDWSKYTEIYHDVFFVDSEQVFVHGGLMANSVQTAETD